MKITAQPKIILAIINALETCAAGIGIAMRCNVSYELKESNSYIEINEMPGEVLKPDDWFWLGYFVREYNN